MILVVSKEIVDDLKKKISCIDGKFSDSFIILMAFFFGGRGEYSGKL